LLLSGMDVARINCAHGDRASYTTIVQNARAASQNVMAKSLRSMDNVSRPDVGLAAIAFDIKGPEIRIGRFDSSIPLHSSGMRVTTLSLVESGRVWLYCGPASSSVIR
jgi:pyruvate kinase